VGALLVLSSRSIFASNIRFFDTYQFRFASNLWRLFFMAANDKAGTNSKKAPTKSEIYAQIVEDTGLSKKDVAAVFDSLSSQIKKSLGGRNGSGLFTVPGLLKMRVVKKPATKARKGVNPFTGQEMMFKAKPASKTVKVAALKGLKDMV
jgi:DNA-binding protein HU-beta